MSKQTLPTDLTGGVVAAQAAQRPPLTAADEELIELRMQLFFRDFANRLGRDPMATGLALYRQVLRGEILEPKAFTDFVAMFPPTPTRRPTADAPTTSASIPTTPPALSVERTLSRLARPAAAPPVRPIKRKGTAR